MGLFRRSRAETVAGRAELRPGSFRQKVSHDVDGHNSNALSHRGHVRLPAFLELVSVEDGGAVAPGPQEISWRIANWVRLVVTGLDDGSGRYDEAPDPSTITIPVRVDVATRRIVEVDDDLVESELEPWRELARDQFKRTEGALRSVHQLGDLLDFGTQLPGIAGEWKQAAADLRAELSTPSGPGAAVSDAEATRRLAEADTQRAALAASPQVLEMMRASLVPQLRQQAEFVRDGHVPGHAFDLDIECHFRSGLLTDVELTELRTTAGTPGFG